MAKTITPLDAHTLMNAIYAQATGKSPLANITTDDFVSVGETVLSTGIENTINALTIVFGKTLVAVRPYSAKITLIQEENTGLYTNRIRKISFYDKGCKEGGWVNTNAHNRNLYDGYDNNSQGTAPNGSIASMWEQDKPVAVEFHFGGTNVYDFCLTLYRDQLKAAFRDDAEFAKFWNGTMVAKQNEIEQMKEEKNRLTLQNYMAGLYDMGMAIDLVAAFNARFNTTYTGDDLRQTHFKEFLAFFVATVKKYSNYFTERSKDFHWSPSVTRDGVTYTDIMRHTPKEDQKLMLLKDFFIEAEAFVLPEIFHPDGLRIENYEGVGYWQSNNAASRSALKITPAIPDTNNPAQQTTGTAVSLDHVLGVLFDRDACLTNYQFEGADSTPFEARKKYQNVWTHVAFNSINDFTENGILFYMAS